MPGIVRSILAVLAGFIVIGLLAFLTGAVVARIAPGTVDAKGIPVTDGARIAQLLYVGVIATFGCWLAGRLAPSQPMKHALALGVLGLIFNVVSVLPMKDQLPAWYWAAGVLTTMLWAYLGGRLAENHPTRAMHAVA